MTNMTIEVKQLIIKSTVYNDRPVVPEHEKADIDLENFKELLLEECRDMIADKLNEIQER
jgi:hypothetical protein